MQYEQCQCGEGGCSLNIHTGESNCDDIKKMNLTVYRGISTNGGIITERIGTSWTLDKQYAIQLAKKEMKSKRHLFAIVFETKITIQEIDWELTVGSFKNPNTADKFKVVLMPNINLAVRTVYASDDGEAAFGAITGAIDETMVEYRGKDFHNAKLRWLEMAKSF